MKARRLIGARLSKRGWHMNKININRLVYILLFTLCSMLLVAMFLVYLLTDISEIFANIVAVVAAVIGVFASIVESVRGKQVETSNDLMTMYGDFIDIEGNKLVEYKLECLKRRNINLFTDEDTMAIRNYLLYFNGVADKILSNYIKIGEINTIWGYRFFLIMNCPYIQDREIIQNAQMYKRCIQLHYKWGLWSKKHHFKRSADQHSLEKRFTDYYKYI